MRLLVKTLALTAGVALAGAASAQRLQVPDASPSAVTSQTVGLTEMTVKYSRPAVRGRKVWGGMVPYGQVWRAGANTNTTVSFSTPVTVDGKPLAEGIYGLHAIPTEKEWTVIFSKQHQAWGSFTYDAKEDALRVTVTPQPATDVAERLAYTFDDVAASSAVLSLRWEKVRVPLKIAVDLPKTVTANLADQLRGIANFDPPSWNQGANWLVNNGGDLATARKWVDTSIDRRKTAAALLTKATILDKTNDAAGAAALRAEADGIATEAERNFLGYQYLQAGDLDKAIAAFRKNTEKFPDSWNTYDSLAEGLATKGDKKGATLNYEKAKAMTKDDVQKARIDAELAKLK